MQVPADATQAARLTLGDGLVTVVVPPDAIPSRGEVSGALTALTQRQRQALERSGIQATNLAASVGVTPQQDLAGPAQVSVPRP